MSHGFGEWDRGKVVLWKAHGQRSHIAVGFNPLAIVLEHAAAWGCAMHHEGMTAYSAEEFGKDLLGECVPEGQSSLFQTHVCQEIVPLWWEGPCWQSGGTARIRASGRWSKARFPVELLILGDGR